MCPLRSYAVGKLAAYAFTLLAAREEFFLSTGVLINAVCPGACATPLTGHAGGRTARKGASTPVWLATAPRRTLAAASGAGGTSGRMYRDKAPFVGFEADWARGVPPDDTGGDAHVGAVGAGRGTA
jgi:NAD(P)-dependent dehydrogenase (short-subunit alcohol dehydrogenase family)